MNALREYQKNIYLKIREALKNNRTVFIQLPTGAGKTALDAAICESVYNKDKRAWIVVPRKELLNQTSAHLKKWNVPHGIIAAGQIESRAFKIHVVSKDTLIRRYDKIKNWPDLLIFDEGHLYLDRQIEIVSHLPEKCKVLAQSATPQRLDGRGLSDLYDVLIEGPSIPDLIRQGYLTDLEYYAPPLEGLSDLKYKGTEIDEETFEELLQRKKVYGKVIEHYQKYGKNKAALIFCRSVKSAHHTAQEFKNHGFKAEAIDGTMPDKTVSQILEKHRQGEIQIICNCLLATYGVDIPRVEYIADISPTLSLALYMQKIGRGLRPFPGKEKLIYMDHVNQILEHGVNGIPPHYLEHINWNFHGTEKRKRDKTLKNVKLCPHLDFLYCQNPTCSTCEHNPDKSVKDARKPMIIVPAELEEVKKPVAMSERSYDDRRIIEDKISEQVLKYKSMPNELPSVIDALVKIADDCGYSPFWIYHQLVTENKHAVQVHILAAIQRAKNFKPGWIYFAKEKIKSRGA
jgi:superfamily II DNA or RNA helicase